MVIPYGSSLELTRWPKPESSAIITIAKMSSTIRMPKIRLAKGSRVLPKPSRA